MLSDLKKLFTPKPKIPRLPFAHPVLGTIVYSEEEGAWMTDSAHASLGFRFHLAGDLAPDSRLLAHAESVASDPAAFRALVIAFLEKEAMRLKDPEETVRKLQIEMLCLFSPERPCDGMIYFTGGERYGVWRCDYKNGRPIMLGFDS